MRLINSILAASVLFTAAAAAQETPNVVSSVRPVQVQSPRDVLTNEGIVLLSDAGFSDSFIVEKMLLSRTRFDVSVEGLAFLIRNGISQELVQFIMERSAKPNSLASATASPNYVPMKVEKRKVLVPDPKAVAAGPAAAPLTPTVYAGRWYLVNASPYQYTYQAPYSNFISAPPVYTLPSSAPIMTPITYSWFGR